MSEASAPDHRANLVGSAWMTAAMGLFAVEDAFIKGAAATLPVGQMLILFGLGGTIVFGALARARGVPLFVPEVVSVPMRIRMGFEIMGRLFYALAIALIPLSAATVILQAAPLVVLLGAALVFGEKVGWRRWTAILTGLMGVLIILQPGTDSFSALSILAVLGMIGFAGRDLASRAAPASLKSSALGFYGFVAIIIAGAGFSLWEGRPFVMPGAGAWMSLTGAVLAGAAGYTSLMNAMRTGEISAVTPFRYTRMLFGILLGVVLFGEGLTLPMMIGSAIIVLSGLFILGRSRRLGKPV